MKCPECGEGTQLIGEDLQCRGECGQRFTPADVQRYQVKQEGADMLAADEARRRSGGLPDGDDES